MGRLLAGLGLWWRSLGDGKVLPRGVLGCPATMGRSTGLGPSGIGAAAVAAVPWVALTGKALPEGLGHPAEHGPQQPHHHALLHARTHIFIEHLNIYLHAQKFLREISSYNFTSGHRRVVSCGCWVALRYAFLLLEWERAQQRGVPVPSQ